jgi:hypothetical protein
MRRNESLASAFEPGITPLATQRNGTTAIAKWAYDRAYELGLPTWFRSRETMKLSDGYRALFSEVSSVPHGRQG